jgi:hypothetical protein
MDVLFNIFAYASCLEEYEHECRCGPIHSYASRLRGDPHRFDHPYADYLIDAFCTHTNTLLSPGKEKHNHARRAKIRLTHDIDATHKAFLTRLKQAAFEIENALRALLVHGRLKMGASKLASIVRFLLGQDRYWCFPKIRDLEDQYHMRSIFYVYTPFPRGSWRNALNRWLFDPSYDINRYPALRKTLCALRDAGWQIGLHLGYDTWKDSEQMLRCRLALEKNLGNQPILTCRQHWLRFSLRETWHAQTQAGFKEDSSLGFNDRPGFRAGLAHAFHPYDHERGKAHDIIEHPMILMDSHLFNYFLLNGEDQIRLIQKILSDVRLVRGEVSLNWHQQVFCREYGYDRIFRHVLTDINQS